MSNAIIPKQNVTALNLNQGIISQDDMNVLRRSKFKDFTDSEIAYCARVINQLNLSPFLNQIHFTRRLDKKTGQSSIAVQVGIDGFRLHAERTRKYAGSDEPTYEYDERSEGKKYPAKASVTVYKMMEGQRCAFTASARWDEYYPGAGPNSFMWDKMPHNQLAKCAEALALRKAFPAELSSLYVEEEMHKERDKSGVYPENPDVDDPHLVQSQSFVIPYGPLARQYIDDADPIKLRKYIEEIEEKARRLNKPIPNWAQEMIKHAEPLLAAFENQGSEEPGWDG